MFISCGPSNTHKHKTSKEKENRKKNKHSVLCKKYKKCTQKVKEVTAEGGVQCWFRTLVNGASWWPLNRHAAALEINEDCTVL